MVINKRIALLLVFLNIIFLIYSIFLFFYFHHTIFPDFSQPEPTGPSNDSIWTISIAFLNIVLYIGLFWVLGVFHEHLLVRGAMLVLILLKLPALISLNWNPLESLALHSLLQSIIIFFGCLAIVMMLILLFVRNKTIRGYFWWFVGSMFVALISPSLGGYVYDDFGIRWLLVDRFLLVWLSFIPTLLLFIKVYGLSNQAKS